MSISHERIALEGFEQAAMALGFTPTRGQGIGNRIPINGAVYYQHGDLRVELPDATVIVEVESSGGVTNLAKYWECFEAGRLAKPIRLLHLFRRKSPNDYASHLQVWRFLATKMTQALGDRFTAQLMPYSDGNATDLAKAVEEFKKMLTGKSAANHSPAVVRLLDQARAMAAASTHPGAATLDVERWLMHWLTKPQPSLGGRRPEELLDTPSGVDVVARVLGAIQSGAFL